MSISLASNTNVDTAIAAVEEIGSELRRDPAFQGKILKPLEVLGVDRVGPDGIVLKGSIRTLPLQQHAVGREINRRVNARFHRDGIW